MPELPEDEFTEMLDVVEEHCPHLRKMLEMAQFIPSGVEETEPRFHLNGNPFFEPLLATRKGRSGAKAKDKVKEPDSRFISAAAEAGVQADDYVWPDRSAEGIAQSMAANLDKRIEHTSKLDTSLADYVEHCVLNPPLPVCSFTDPALGAGVSEWRPYYEDIDECDPASVFDRVFEKRLQSAVLSLKPDKSSGWTGELTGHKLKGPLLEDPASRELTVGAARERLWLYCHFGTTVARMSAAQMVLIGARDPVVPSVKGEMTPARKVFKRANGKDFYYDPETRERVRLANPRWRSIFSQSAVDEIVGRVLEKPHNARQQALYACGGAVWTGIGTGSDDRNARLTKARVAAAAWGSVKFVTESDDVSGMDWCGSGWSIAVDACARMATAHSCCPLLYTPAHRRLSEMIFSAMLAYACSLGRSTYLVGIVLWVQLVQGINDSGVLSTGFKNSHPRAFIAWLCGALGATACGDDCVAVYPAGACDSEAHTKVAALRGFEIRDQEVVEGGSGEGFECCSKRYSWTHGPEYSFLNLDKAISRVAHECRLTADVYSGLLFETRHDPENRARWVNFRKRLLELGCENVCDDVPPGPCDCAWFDSDDQIF
jgi:hypothetical protein